MLLSGEPSIIGREPAGHSATIATHQPALTAIAAAPAAKCPMRTRTLAGAATRYTRANPGTTRNACIILARKARPISVPAAASHRADARSTARTRQ